MPSAVSVGTDRRNAPDVKLLFHRLASTARDSVSSEVGGVDADAKKSLSSSESMAQLLINLSPRDRLQTLTRNRMAQHLKRTCCMSDAITRSRSGLPRNGLAAEIVSDPHNRISQNLLEHNFFDEGSARHQEVGKDEVGVKLMILVLPDSAPITHLESSYRVSSRC